MIYLDTSALVKKYVIEAGTDEVRALFKKENTVITSKLTFAEVSASFARKLREGGIEKQSYNKIWASFLSDWEAFTLVEVREEIFHLIHRLTGSHPLRGADAVHLSSALWVGEEIGQPLRFVASDSMLLTAAAKEGIEVINPAAAAI